MWQTVHDDGIDPTPRRSTVRPVWLFGGLDPLTGKQVMMTGSAEDEDAATRLRNKFRRQVAQAHARA
jgi:hypothetical protein